MGATETRRLRRQPDPGARYGYRVGLPAPGRWRELLNTDAAEWGGSGVGNYGAVVAERSLLARATVVGCGHPAAARRAVAGARLSRRR